MKWAILLITLTACTSYTATVQTPQGDYAVTTKSGTLITLTEPDGTTITADDRGQPKQPGVFHDLFGLMAAQAVK